MRALAEFIMRGRLQASLVALAGNLVPLISPATVALVTLRHPLQEGLLVLLWACLPLLAMVMWGDVSPLLAATSLVGVVGVVPVAQVLRQTQSWPLTLAAILTVSGAAMGLVASVAGEATTLLLAELQGVLETLKAGDTPQTGSVFHLLMGAMAVGMGLEQASVLFVLGFLAWLTAMQLVASLLLGRWWQALLYNPGGFRAEFHGLRLDRVLAAGLIIGIVACNLGAAELGPWASLLGLPLLLAGLGLVHYTVQFWQLGVQWLVLLYFGLVIFSPLSLVLVGIAFLDSVFDFRARLRPRKGQ